MKISFEKIEELKKLVEELKLSKVFEELDNLKISDLRLTKLRNDFVLGKADSDYYERLIAFLDDLKNKELEIHKSGHISYNIPTKMYYIILFSSIVVIFILLIVSNLLINKDKEIRIDTLTSLEKPANHTLSDEDTSYIIRIQKLILEYYNLVNERNIERLDDLFASYLNQYYLQTGKSKEFVINEIQDHWKRIKNESHSVVMESLEIQKLENMKGYVAKFLLGYSKNSNLKVNNYKIEMRFNTDFEIYYIKELN